jgi:hypothetical protein
MERTDMSEEIDNEAVDTMIMLDMEVRKKIRSVLLDMVRNPQDVEEESFVMEVVSAAERRQRSMEVERARRELKMTQVYAREQQRRVAELAGATTLTTRASSGL